MTESTTWPLGVSAGNATYVIPDVNNSTLHNSPGNSTVDDHASLWAAILNELNEWQRAMIEDYPIEGKQCMLKFWYSPVPKGHFCNATWDGYSCWPATAPGSTVVQPCPMKVKPNDSEAVAHRTCRASGEWQGGAWTNYSLCLGDYHRTMLEPDGIQDDVWKAMILRDIYFYGSILSCILLVVTLLIFCCFKSLQCNRISIHKNLVVSFMIRSVIFIVVFEPFVTDRENSYRDIGWLCKLLTSILYYSVVANIFWMFVEGLFLHNRVAVSVFNTEAPFLIFHIIGWGSPALIVLAWAICMHLFNPEPCWNEAYKYHYMWIIVVPVILALAVNAVFLFNIIRILITKLRANNTVELDQVRKAVKATVILFPLLGMTHILFFFKPQELNSAGEMAYRVTHAIFQASQGVFVSYIYCFMNSEVRVAIMKRWQRYKSQRMGSKNDRRRSSTARSSTILVPLNGGVDKSKQISNVRKYKVPVDDYSVTWEEDFSTVQTTP